MNCSSHKTPKNKMTRSSDAPVRKNKPTRQSAIDADRAIRHAEKKAKKEIKPTPKQSPVGECLLHLRDYVDASLAVINARLCKLEGRDPGPMDLQQLELRKSTSHGSFHNSLPPDSQYLDNAKALMDPTLDVDMRRLLIEKNREIKKKIFPLDPHFKH